MTIVPDLEEGEDDVFEPGMSQGGPGERKEPCVTPEVPADSPSADTVAVAPSSGIRLERISSSGSIDEVGNPEISQNSSTESIDSALGSNSPSSIKSMNTIS